jgi:hypothetical protein
MSVARPIAVLLLGALALLGPIAARAVSAAGSDITVYYYDPGAGIQAPDAFETKVNGLLEKIGTGIRLQAFGRLQDLKGQVDKKRPDFLILPPYLRAEASGGADLTPLLIRERDHSSFFDLVMVGSGKVDDLRGKTLAAAGDAVLPSFLDGVILKGTPLKSKDIRVLQVGKDIDGVLAAGTGQAAAACASPGSIELVKKANPAVAPNLAVIHTVSAIPFATVFAVASPDPAKVVEVKRVLGDLQSTPDGRKVLKLLKADRLVAIDPALREKMGL